MRTPTLLLLASVIALAPAAAQEKPGARLDKAAQKTVVEPKTGIEFPAVITSLGSETKHMLTGVGARTKTIFNVKVYAVGLYVDAQKAARTLVEYKKTYDNRKEQDKAIAQELMSDQFGKTLRLVMARDVDAEDMREAFEDELRPRIKKQAKEKEMTKGEEALETFRGYFKEDPKKGDEIIFSWQPGGRLHTRIQGKDMPMIESPLLCWALFDVYVGDKPISKKAREAFVRGTPELFQKYAAAQNERGPEGQPVEAGGATPEPKGGG